MVLRISKTPIELGETQRIFLHKQQELMKKV